MRQLRQQPERSSRSVGTASGLNHQTVERLRTALAASGDIRQTDTRAGEREGGYTYRPRTRPAGELPEQSGADWLQDKLAGALGGSEVAASPPRRLLPATDRDLAGGAVQAGAAGRRAARRRRPRTTLPRRGGRAGRPDRYRRQQPARGRPVTRLPRGGAVMARRVRISGPRDLAKLPTRSREAFANAAEVVSEARRHAATSARSRCIGSRDTAIDLARVLPVWGRLRLMATVRTSDHHCGDTTRS